MCRSSGFRSQAKLAWHSPMTPLECGQRPVKSEARDGLHPGFVQKLRENRTPSAARASRFGVCTVFTP